jgi:zinc protease
MERLLRRFSLGILIVTALLVSCRKQTDKIFPFKVNEVTLSNGLKVVSIPYDSPGVIAYLTVVRVGSRNEVEPGRTGYAHFCEHLMFKGTEKYPSQKYNEIYRQLGAESNAFTSDDWTCYFAVATSDALEKIIDLESDRFINLNYSEESYKSEAGVILGEYYTESSSPYGAMYEKLHEAAFTMHTYGHTTMGYKKDIEDMPYHYDYSLKFFDRYYRPDNCIIVVVGDFAQSGLINLIKKYYGNWKSGAYQVKIPVEPPQPEEKKIDISWENETLPFLLIGYRVPAFSDNNIDVAAIQLMSQLVFSSSSSLYRKLVIDEQKVEFLSAEFENHADPFLFTIMTSIRNPEDIDGVCNDIYQAIESAKVEQVAKDRLDNIKSHMKYSFAMGLDTPLDVAFALGQYLHLTSNTESVNRFYERFDSVTPEDIQRVAKKYFTPNNRTIVTLTYGGEI